MKSADRIKKTIDGRICCVISKGASINELEQKIELFRDKKICWIIQNRFNYIEDGILKKIGERADIVADCATVFRPELFEKEVRYDRFYNYLMRGNNLLCTSNAVLDQNAEYKEEKKVDLRELFNNEIVTIDSIFSESECEEGVWDKPPNSFTLLLAFLIAGQAKKIIIFGLDGAIKGDHIINSYYRPDIVAQERRLAFGDTRDGTVISDGQDFKVRWEYIFDLYKRGFNNLDVEILNCSPNTIFETFKVINYDQLKGVINE